MTTTVTERACHTCLYHYVPARFCATHCKQKSMWTAMDINLSCVFCSGDDAACRTCRLKSDWRPRISCVSCAHKDSPSCKKPLCHPKTRDLYYPDAGFEEKLTRMKALLQEAAKAPPPAQHFIS